MNLVSGKLYFIRSRVNLYGTSIALSPDETNHIEIKTEKIIVMFITSRLVSVHEEADMEEFEVLYKGKILYCGYRVDIDWEEI